MTSEPSASLPADDLDPADRIGRRLAAIRAERGWPVSELARRVGVSPSLISQIERGQSRPSVSTLVALAKALDVAVDDLFASDGKAEAQRRRARVAPVPPPRRPSESAVGPSPPHRYLVRRDERRVIEIEGGVRWERLTPATPERADVVELVYGPHAESHSEGYRHPGSEMVLVTSGRLVIEVDGEPHDLGPGDSIYFPSTCEHRYVNPTDEEARAVCARVDGRPPPA
jgi:transcriptional regulator with XRE-family HTH domain